MSVSFLNRCRTGYATLAVLAFALAGCSGNTVSPPAQTSIAPSLEDVTFSITIPAAGPGSTSRRPAYVSSATQSLSIVATPSGGSPGTPTVINCTTVCTGAVAAAIGTDTFTAKLYDAQNAGGHLLSTGSATATIVAGGANNINLTFNGVVASISVVLGAGLLAGTPSTIGVTVNALDGAGDIIIAPGVYVNSSGTPVSITLADSDTSGATLLSATTVTQPTTGITLTYTGGALSGSPSIGASAPSVTSASTPITVTAPGSVVLSPTSLSFLGTGASNALPVTASQTSSSNVFVATTPASGQPNSCSGIATISPASGAAFTVTPIAVGLCTFTFAGANSQSTVLNVSVTTTTVGGS